MIMVYQKELGNLCFQINSTYEFQDLEGMNRVWSECFNGNMFQAVRLNDIGSNITRTINYTNIEAMTW